VGDACVNKECKTKTTARPLKMDHTNLLP